MEVTICSNGVIVYDADAGFFGGSAKARDIKAGGILKMVEEAKRLNLQ